MKKVLLLVISFLTPCLLFAQSAEPPAALESPQISEETTTIISEAESDKEILASEETTETTAETETDEVSEIEEESATNDDEDSEEAEPTPEELALQTYEAALATATEKETEIKAYYLDKFKTAENKKQTVAAELGQQTDLQTVKDELRLIEDTIYAARRTDEETTELNRRKAALDFLLNERGEEFGAKTGAEDVIAAAENIKAKIWELRENVRQRSEAYNSERDAQAADVIDKINNAPFGESETDSSGEPTRTALQRRTNLCNAELAAAAADEETYLNQLKAEIAPAEKEYFTQLRAAYTEVDTGKYQTTSFTQDVILRVGNFNGDKGYWKANISSGIFGYTGLLDMDFEITYEELFGKKFVTADLMTEEEFAEFKNNVALYDHLFRINSNAVYAKVYYEIKHWKETSEYRFMPSRLEILRVGETPKVIHKESRIQAKNFINYSCEVYEVRSESDIQKDIKRAAKIVEREQKKAGTYNPAYSYSGGSTSDMVPQKGRGAVCITPSTILPTVGLDMLNAEVTFGIGKFAFIGADFGIEVPFINEQIMEYGIVGGANYQFGRFVRPYAKVTANITNTYYGKLKIGGGIDFTFGVFMLNVSYDYGWNFDFNNHFNPNIDKSILTEADFDVKHNNDSKISVGFGIAF